jgi:hypothetical protein
MKSTQGRLAWGPTRQSHRQGPPTAYQKTGDQVSNLLSTCTTSHLWATHRPAYSTASWPRLGLKGSSLTGRCPCMASVDNLLARYWAQVAVVITLRGEMPRNRSRCSCARRPVVAQHDLRSVTTCGALKRANAVQAMRTAPLPTSLASGSISSGYAVYTHCVFRQIPHLHQIQELLRSGVSPIL